MDGHPGLLGPEAALAYGYHVQDREGARRPLLTDHRFDPLHPSFLERIPTSSFDDGPLSDGRPDPGACAPTKETFEMDADVLRVIADACGDYEEDELTPFVQEPCHPQAPKPPPLWELPLVTAASEAEYRALVRRVQTVDLITIEVDDIPLDVLDADRGQGISFPLSAYEQMDEMDSALNQGILVTKESLVCLAQLLGNDDHVDQDRALLEELIPPRWKVKKPLDFHITPPATPRFPQAEPFIPDLDSAQVHSPSEPRSLLSEDLKIAEAVIFDGYKDEIQPPESPTAACSMTNPFLDSSSDGPLLLVEPPEKRLADYKLEVPIVGDNLPDSPTVNVGFEAHQLPPLSNIADEECDQMEHKLHKKIQEVAKGVSQRGEQEHLDPLDGLVRIKVPLVDFSRPSAPWSHLAGDAEAMFRHIIHSHPDISKLPKWPVDKRAERELRWVLTTSSGTVSTSETIVGEEDFSLDEFLGVADDAPDSAFYLERPGDLAVLRCSQDSDGEAEPRFNTPPSAQEPASESSPSLPESDELMRLVRKRKKELMDTDVKKLRKRARDEADAQPRESLLMDGRHPKCANLLRSFLRIRGRRLPDPELSSQAAAQSASGAGEDNRAVRKSTAIDTEIQPVISPRPVVVPPSDGENPRIVPKAPPEPLVDLPRFGLKLIISINLPRCLVRGLQDILPGVEFIERDYNAYNSTTWNAGGTPAPSTIMSPLGDEADIAVSPATGIIAASTVQVRQQPMAGCGDDNMLQQRVRRAGPRYERLVVLVSDGSLDSATACPMSEADRLALARFQAFAAQLDTVATVSVYWVGGGQVAIARWVASFACASAASMERLRPLLVQDETLWELFLRRAGMNAFAAQAVCGILQDPGARGGGRVAAGAPGQLGDHGLPAFLKMSAQERAERFAEVLGGRRLLDRVGEVLDQGWRC